MSSSACTSASLAKRKGSYEGVAKLARGKKKEVNKQAGKCPKDTASKGTVNANTIN